MRTWFCAHFVYLSVYLLFIDEIISSVMFQPHTFWRDAPNLLFQPMSRDVSHFWGLARCIVADASIYLKPVQDAVASSTADVLPPPHGAAPDGFWAAEAALLSAARCELTRLGVARGLAAGLPPSALQAVRPAHAVPHTRGSDPFAAIPSTLVSA